MVLIFVIFILRDNSNTATILAAIYSIPIAFGIVCVVRELIAFAERVYEKVSVR
jgi:hypothetical protein